MQSYRTFSILHIQQLNKAFIYVLPEQAAAIQTDQRHLMSSQLWAKTAITGASSGSASAER